MEVKYTLKHPNNGVFAMVIEGECIVEGVGMNKRDAIEISEIQQLNLQTTQGLYILFIEVPLR
jgi:hypothetical protein